MRERARERERWGMDTEMGREGRQGTGGGGGGGQSRRGTERE